MRKLISAFVIGLTVVTMTVGVFGQDPGGIDSLAFGNPDGSAIEVFIDDEISVPIWLKCDENIAFVHFCLATENNFISDRFGAIPNGILEQWTLDSPQPVDGWPEDGLTSQSLVGIADFSLPETNYINTNGEWVEIGAFIVRSANNPDLMGQTSQLYPGEDPVEGITMMFDELWSPIVPGIVSSPLEFLVNSPPGITSPIDETTIPINNPFDIAFPVIAVDDDDDEITLQIDFPYDNYEFTEVESYPGYTHFEFSWTPPDSCSEIVDINITAVDVNNLDDEINTYLDVQPIVVTVSSDTTLPGYPASVDINMTINGENSNIGSFNFSFIWDPNALTFQSVFFGPDFADWEYMNFTVDPDGPGTLRLLGMANHDVGENPPLTQGEYFVGTIYFTTLGDPELQGIVAPLDMPVNDLANNVLSDSSGYLVFHPLVHQGDVTFIDFGDVLVGDINLNLLPFETGDAVTFIDHLVDPVEFPFNITQRFASDCNQDGVPETIADLIFLFNVINGDSPNAGGGSDVVAGMRFDRRESAVSVQAQAECPVGGALITINHAGVIIDRINTVDGMEIRYKDDGSILTALVYSSEFGGVNGSDLLSFDIIEGNPENITIDYFDISDSDGNLLSK
ncbi:MAG: hypothetical protein GY839_01525 [candidate division Zixibacteria bacterium]|nr:hypothetical protein [candidate division Zixibacteria bacterium]